MADRPVRDLGRLGRVARLGHERSRVLPLVCAHRSAVAVRVPELGRPSPEIRNRRGKLDLELVRPPRVIFAEVKVDGGRLTDEQAARIARLRECPGIEVYARWPRDWPDVVRVLARPEWDLDLILPPRWYRG